ncbi:hypothetical protein SALBM217S_09362 [Streptomyces griseoloalbus]
MGHRKEEQDRRLVVGAVPEDGVEQLDGVVHLGEEVAVGEGAALGPAGGAGGVDESGEGVGAEHAPAHFDLVVGYVGAGVREGVDVPLLHDPHVPQVGQVRQFRADGGGLAGRLGDQGDGAGVLEDPAGLVGGRGGIDGDGDQAGGPGGEVEDGPLVDGAGHDRDAVAGGEALGDESLRGGEDLGGESFRRDIPPGAVPALPAEDDVAGRRVRVLERQVGERAVPHRLRERRHGRLPDGPVQPAGGRRDEDGRPVDVGVESGGVVRGGHERLLGRAGELRGATTYVPRTPRRSPEASTARDATGRCGDRTAPA